MFKYYTYNDIENGGQHDFEVEVSRDYFVGKFGWDFINAREKELEKKDKDFCVISNLDGSKCYTIIYERDLATCNICGVKFDNVNNAYESHICDKCFDEHFGYCDNCGEVFAYHKHMCDDGFGVFCGKCVAQIDKKDWRK